MQNLFLLREHEGVLYSMIPTTGDIEVKQVFKLDPDWRIVSITDASVGGPKGKKGGAHWFYEEKDLKVDRACWVVVEKEEEESQR